MPRSVVVWRTCTVANVVYTCYCSAMRLSGRDRGPMVQQKQKQQREAADGTALRSVRLSLLSLNELAARSSSDP